MFQAWLRVWVAFVFLSAMVQAVEETTFIDLPPASSDTCLAAREAWQPAACLLGDSGATLLEDDDLSGRYIIRFTEYRLQSTHKEAVQAALVSLHGQGYRWIDRWNAATKHPTDFGIVQMQPESTRSIQGLLRAQPWVKGINPDRRLSRSLTWDPEEEKSEADDSCASQDPLCVQKRPGRMQTAPTIGLFGKGDDDPETFLENTGRNISRRHLAYPFSAGSHSVTTLFQAEKLWSQGFKGAKVRMGVFDTGIRKDHPHVKNIEERSNWTHEPTLADGLGHGSFVAGVIASQDNQCPGFAPEVELHTFRVFTNDQVSYTSWFLDAFNYAIATEMNVVNLSIGGPDYLDEPFVDKVLEITSHGLIMISAIGNDGPNYGTLNNPADQNDVIGVGGIDFSDNIAAFSSRGMSTWELPGGYGRAKPDVVAYGKDVSGSKIQTGCRTLSGTSVASPVVAGAVCLLASVVPEDKRWSILNPASMKQALVEGAVVLNGPHMFEQGQGKINLVNSMNILKKYKPRASAVPAKVDLTLCPYMWPLCKQPLYASALPVMLNMTVLNGMGVTGRIATEPKWLPDASGVGKHVDIQFSYSSVLWPWSGYLALYITVRPSGATARGTASGRIELTVTSPPAPGESSPRVSTVVVPFKANVIPTPPRENRLLWDQFHSIRYPPGYIPRDNLDVRSDILDWHGDHPHTNYKDMFNFLIDAGYYVEVLGKPFTCFDASNFGSLVLADSEEEYYPEEVEKLSRDIGDLGLGLIVFAEWYNKDMLIKMRFFDDNTRSWWTPYTGGGNVPALNDLLAPYNIALGDAVLTGMVSLGQSSAKVSSGANIIQFPKGSYVHTALMQDRSNGPDRTAAGRIGGSRQSSGQYPVLGMASFKKGRIAVFGDANCLDSSHQTANCYLLLRQLLEFTSAGRESTQLFTAASRIHEAIGGNGHTKLPERRSDLDFKDVSTVLNYPASCDSDMDNAAWDRRSIFQRTTQEGTLLAKQGISDFGGGDPGAPVINTEKPPPPVQQSQEVAELNARDKVDEHAENPPNNEPSQASRPAPEAQVGSASKPRVATQAPAPEQREAPAGLAAVDSQSHKQRSTDHRPLIMGKDQMDVAGLPEIIPHMGNFHMAGLAGAGLIFVLMLWRMSRRQRSANTPRVAGTSRAYRRVFSP
mmetsp:Transcript_1171/g.3431  ORF Transcript_1171/g.3431 Transcript_1171/m.3431 type:complete len:1157 (-) Transcript_1171:13-3483(-)